MDRGPASQDPRAFVVGNCTVNDEALNFTRSRKNPYQQNCMTLRQLVSSERRKGIVKVAVQLSPANLLWRSIHPIL